MSSERADIKSVNGYDVIKSSENVYKVFDDDQQYGPDFSTFQDAAEHALALPDRKPPQK